MNLSGLPGADLIQKGIRDLKANKRTIPALLVSIGLSRLRRAKLTVPKQGIPDPEHRLYKQLASTNSATAHSRYNALIRRLVRFERALECVR